MKNFLSLLPRVNPRFHRRRTYLWKELPIPEELIPDSERLLKTALDPEIFIEKSEKVKVKKKVVQKSKIPFAKEKEKS